MQNKSKEPDTPVFDYTYFDEKITHFKREYDEKATRALIAELSAFKPDVEITIDDIHEQYPYYSQLLVEHPLLEEMVDHYFEKLQPFLQSPFPLPGKQVSQGPWVGAYKLNYFSACDVNKETIANKRVLDIGCNAGFDTFYLSTLGPSEVIGIDPIPLFYYQALFLWSVYYCPNLRFVNIGWQDVKKNELGKFDLINCQGILYHEPNPLQLIEVLFDLLAPGGKLVLETHITLDNDVKMHFVEKAFWGDLSWFWIPSVEAACAMLRASGFENIQVRSQWSVPSKNPDDPEHTPEGHPAGGRAFLTAHRPEGESVYRPKYGWI
jgi:tRNA (mo5U34)-methyltransferase